MIINDTIYALATPSGKSGVAIIRISGNAAKKVFNFFHIIEKKERVLFKTKITSPKNKEIIDEALVVYFNSPHSFTGEDIVELHVHGSSGVIAEILSVLSTIPEYRIANPGEFTKRAFLSNKLDLTQVEALADLIEAETQEQVYQANRQIQGQLKKTYINWKKGLLNSLAKVEAMIDFPEEDQSIPEQLNFLDNLSIIKDEISQALNSKAGEIIKNGLTICIIGPPNAGKSSLINYLSKKETAIVSSQPGTTRDVVEVHLNLFGYSVVFADTAGIRQTQDLVEKEGVKRAIKRAEDAEITVAVFDGDIYPDLDKETLANIDKETIILVNKSDKLTNKNIKLKNTLLHKKDIIFISVKEELGIDQLLDRINFKINEIFSLQTSIAPLTRERQREALLLCLEYIVSAARGEEPELVAEDLRLSLRALGKLVGEVDIEDVLDKLFFDFCIGK